MAIVEADLPLNGRRPGATAGDAASSNPAAPLSIHHLPPCITTPCASRRVIARIRPRACASSHRRLTFAIHRRNASYGRRCGKAHVSPEKPQLFVAEWSGLAPEEVRKANVLYLGNAISE